MGAHIRSIAYLTEDASAKGPLRLRQHAEDQVERKVKWVIERTKVQKGSKL